MLSHGATITPWADNAWTVLAGVDNGGVVTSESGFTATTGPITATAGAVVAGTTVTAATGITSTTGNILATAGLVTGGTGVVAATGNVQAAADVIAVTGDTQASLGYFKGIRGALANYTPIANGDASLSAEISGAGGTITSVAGGDGCGSVTFRTGDASGGSPNGYVKILTKDGAYPNTGSIPVASYGNDLTHPTPSGVAAPSPFAQIDVDGNLRIWFPSDGLTNSTYYTVNWWRPGY